MYSLSITLSKDNIKVCENGESETFSEVKAHVNGMDWMMAIQDEMKSLHNNQTYELAILLKGKRALKNKWVYLIKHEEGSTKPGYKARLIVKGFG